MKAIIDKYLDFAISKKLTVFIIGTIFVILGKLNGDQWLILASTYTAIQGFLDFVKEYLKKRN